MADGSASQIAHLWGRDNAIDNQACNLSGGGNLYNFLGGAYTRGSLVATPADTPCFTFGNLASTDNISAFVNSAESNKLTSAKAYLDGQSPTSISAYLEGTF